MEVLRAYLAGDRRIDVGDPRKEIMGTGSVLVAPCPPSRHAGRESQDVLQVRRRDRGGWRRGGDRQVQPGKACVPVV